nr:Gag-Pol polyprotein [Tanacetum cinerariifolium]
MTRQRLHTYSEVRMYALTVSTIEPKNIKEAMADQSWIESMQDELNQLERLQVWKFVPRPGGKNIIALNGFGKISVMLNILSIIHLPQATDNNHDSFVPPPSFYDMIPFYKNHLGFTIKLKTPSSFKTTGLLQSWQTGIQRKVGMKIPDWMITDAMKQTKHYRMTPSAPTSPTPKVDASALTRSTVICLRLPQRRSTRLKLRALLLTVDKADELILQDTLQVSLAEYKSRQEQEARENVAVVDEH